MNLSSPHLIVLIATLLNAMTFLAYWRDKAAARKGERRISEASLLWLAALGGSIGAVAAQRLLQHKTRKQPFATILLGIVMLQSAAALAFFAV